MKIFIAFGTIAVLTLSLISSESSAGCLAGDRYEDNGNGTVTDCRSGLVWLKDAKCTATSGGIPNPGGGLVWQDALKWVAGLQNGICSLTDGSFAGEWRLPTKTEWMAMVAFAKKMAYTSPVLTDATGTAQWSAGNIFDNVQSNWYWSSTSYPIDTDFAWLFAMHEGNFAYVEKSGGYFEFIWPVRGGASASFGPYGALFIQ